jgi:hypothetical protein
MTYREKIRCLVVGLIVALAAAWGYSAPAVYIEWDWTDSNTQGRVYEGASSGNYTTNYPVSTNVFRANVPLSTTRYFAVTAVSRFGDESAFSNELMIQRIKPAPPAVQKYTVVLK